MLDFSLFVLVVDRGGFTAASRTLRTLKSTLSRRIQRLESSFGVLLLNRTASRKSPRALYVHAEEVPVLEEQGHHVRSLLGRSGEAVGTNEEMTMLDGLLEKASVFPIDFQTVAGRPSAPFSYAVSGKPTIHCQVPSAA